MPLETLANLKTFLRLFIGEDLFSFPSPSFWKIGRGPVRLPTPHLPSKKTVSGRFCSPHAPKGWNWGHRCVYDSFKTGSVFFLFDR